MIVSMTRSLILIATVLLVLGGCGGGTTSAPSEAPQTPNPFATTTGSSYSQNDGSYYTSDYTQDEEDEWAYQEGDYWQLFSDAYDSGWDTGCDVAFEGSPDGYLYDQGDQYSADDCYANNPYDASSGSDVPAEIPDDPEAAGDELGQHDGCVSAFEDLTLYGVLNYGADSYDESVCP